MFTLISEGSLYDLFEYGVVTAGTATDFTVSYDNGWEKLALTGSFGGYSGGYPTTGTIRGGTYTVDGTDLFRLSGASISVPDFTGYVYDDDLEGLMRQILAGADQIVGSREDDVLSGFAGGDELTGNAGDDVLAGDEGNDLLAGGTADDALIGGVGNDRLDGGAGTDVAVYLDAQAGVTVSLAAVGAQSTGAAGVDTLIGIEQLVGSNFADRLTGDAASNYLGGYDGNDRLSAGAGSDLLEGGVGDDHLDGGSGNDVIYGGMGNDTFVVDSATDGVIEYYGEGVDTVLASVSFALTDGWEIEKLTLTGSGANSAWGNDYGNVLTGNAAGNQLYGGFGDDRLSGGAGHDTLDGGSGLDRLYGGTGNDTYFVNDTTDYAYENAGEGTDTVVASLSHTLRANVENLRLTGTDWLSGRGNDLANSLTGNFGTNSLYGLAGDDRLYGAEGDDRLDGGAGVDRLYGGLGDDTYIVSDTTDYA